jgi:CheY-like chemotaxis protein
MATKENKRIVIMEDSSALVKVLRTILEKNGYAVEDAPNGKVGLQKVDSFHPGLALVDIMMPEMDGFEATRRIRERYPEVNIVVFSAQPPQAVEKLALEAGADLFLQKPLREPILLGIAKKFTTTEIPDAEVFEEKILPFEDDQPYRVHVRCCYFCGHENVNVFAPFEDGISENWDAGLYTTYESKPGFQPWDFLRTSISVCPSCLFASKNLEDFAPDRNHLQYPFEGGSDAKRLMVRGIGNRRRIVASDANLEIAFSNPNRNQQFTLSSFQLAAKSGNGLVMVEKPGVYTDVGYYNLMAAVIRFSMNHDKYEYQNALNDALNLFMNQLKVPHMGRVVRAKTYYFLIVLHMAIGKSIRANELKQELEEFYLKQGGAEDAGMEERLWNERLLHVWKDGVNVDLVRNCDW